MKKVIKVPIKGNQVYDSKIYTDNENCYMAQALKSMGYKNICVDPNFLSIEGVGYSGIFNSDFFKEKFKKGKDFIVTITKYT